MKKNKQASLSKSSEKKGDLLIQVDELMQKLENQYGPLMLEELQKRLLKTINDFQDDVIYLAQKINTLFNLLEKF